MPASVRDGECRDAEVHPDLESAHAEAVVQSGSSPGAHGELDVARDESVVGAAGAIGRSEIQVEDRHRVPADRGGEVLRVRIDDEIGKGDALAAVPEGQPSGVINGSGERRYDDLAAADREEQCRLGSCWGNRGDGDTGMLESRRYRRIDDDVGALAGVLELVPLVASVPPVEVLLPLEPLLQAATTSPAATITAIAGSREQLRSKPIFPPEAS